MHSVLINNNVIIVLLLVLLSVVLYITMMLNTMVLVTRNLCLWYIKTNMKILGWNNDPIIFMYIYLYRAP